MFESQLPLSTCWEVLRTDTQPQITQDGRLVTVKASSVPLNLRFHHTRTFQSAWTIKTRIKCSSVCFNLVVPLTAGESCGLFGLFMHVTSENVLLLPPNDFFIFGISPFTVQRLNHISVGRYCPMTDKPVLVQMLPDICRYEKSFFQIL